MTVRPTRFRHHRFPPSPLRLCFVTCSRSLVYAYGHVCVYSFCKKAKAVLDEMKVPYTAYELNEMGDEGKALRAELAERTGRTSVPNTFISGESIGGCNDGPGLMTLKANGELDTMLRAAGVLE